ncbi:hypothetical protein [Pseudalkalibacillus sp. SCS-8]|uniref:hypothetical protein n=1 Tax=Pseudalkalibacillus nanhaiensis TaxID=3115291 RepID=UPI0032DA7C67
MFKKISIVFIVIVFIGLTIWFGRYFYIKNLYTKPYEMIDSVVYDAKVDSENSEYVISEKKWNTIKDESVFANARKTLDWKAFKEFINECEGPSKTLNYNTGKATRNVMETNFKDDHMNHFITCDTFDPNNGNHIDSKYVVLYTEKVAGEWKVVGWNGEIKE